MRKHGPRQARPVLSIQTYLLERAGSVRRTIAGRSVVASPCGAEVGAAAAAVGAARHVVELALVGIDAGSVGRRMTGDAVDAADQRSRDAGSTEYQPARRVPVDWTVDRDAGVRIANG